MEELWIGNKNMDTLKPISQYKPMDQQSTECARFYGSAVSRLAALNRGFSLSASGDSRGSKGTPWNVIPSMAGISIFTLSSGPALRLGRLVGLAECIAGESRWATLKRGSSLTASGDSWANKGTPWNIIPLYAGMATWTLSIGPLMTAGRASAT